eukprot:2327270-Prymnesium_polylepis.1
MFRGRPAERMRLRIARERSVTSSKRPGVPWRWRTRRPPCRSTLVEAQWRLRWRRCRAPPAVDPWLTRAVARE